MKKLTKKSIIIICLAAVLLAVGIFGIVHHTAPKSVYADAAQWAYLETDVTGKDADVFFINPTVYLGDETHLQWLEYDEATKASFVGAINMEKGIYDANARFFAPLYHQAALSAYYASEDKSVPVFEAAYKEIKDAFNYYLKHYNNGRPIILAGFSQGGDMCIRLMKDVFKSKKLQKQLVACYAIGWRISEDEMKENKHLAFAQSADDTGVIIAFNSEAPEIADSLMVPKGTKTLAINPLNWKTDGTVADKSLNKGACFTDYSGNIKSEIPELTGAYIDSTRGALKITDVTGTDYPGVLFDNGIFHLYDYQFFYRNLQENVAVRIKSYLSGKAK